MTPLDFLLDCHRRGLRFRLKPDSKFTLAPLGSITEADRSYITANRDAVLNELRISLALLSPCPVCPGHGSDLCCGGPDLDEWRLPDGRIVQQYCVNGCDVNRATHHRRRGETTWTKIEAQDQEEPTGATP